MPFEKDQPFSVVTVGSGNIEHILEHDGEITPGQKHIVKAHELFGGSCLNYTYRLMAAGYEVFPIPLVGDDPSGHKIRAALAAYGRRREMPEAVQAFIQSNDFLLPHLDTPQTTVVVHAGRRTIFSPVLGAARAATENLARRLYVIESHLANDKAAVMIGHILLNGEASEPGELTKKIINRFYTKHMVFLNFGRSQYRHGISFWEKPLANVDLLQLNLGEIRLLFQKDNRAVTLLDVVNWLKKHAITAVITLNQLGALGTYGDGGEGLVYARPLKIPAMVDPTGAGDAFAAGMVAALEGNKNFSLDEFQSAVDQGRLWASYACTKIGASADCPDLKTLAAFQKQCTDDESEMLHITDDKYAQQIMSFIDEAY